VSGGAAGSRDGASLELDLARRPEVYLVVDADASRLSIRIRAMEVDAVSLRDIRTAWQGNGVAPGPPPTIEVPTVWTVTEPPTAEWRRVVAPAELAPYTDDRATGDVGAAGRPSPTPGASRPDRFTVSTDSGWRLAVATSVRDAVAVGGWRRVVRGWRRVLHGPEPAVPPTLVLVVSAPDDARRLIHLFRPGAAVLLVGGSSGDAGSDPR
jgi:hypothetical protein